MRHLEGGIAQRFPPSTPGSTLHLWLIVCSFPASTVGIQTVASISAGMHFHAGAWERENISIGVGNSISWLNRKLTRDTWETIRECQN